MDLSLPGMVGAAFGLAVGWANFKMIGGIVGAKWVQKRREVGLGDHPDTVKYGNWINFAIFCCTQLAFPILGYFTGLELAG